MNRALVATCLGAGIAAALAIAFLTQPGTETGVRPSPLPLPTKSARLPSRESPFWEAARVASPAKPREPSVIDPASLGISPVTVPIDHARQVSDLLKRGDTKELQDALPAWFEAHPAAAADWLEHQASLADYQPALARISGQIAEAGDPRHALEWAATLEPGPLQEQTLFDIYALARRGGVIGEDEIRAAPLPPDRIQNLVSGAPGY
ncbi:hypothetical protein [Luteolibacter soli]|uniref:Uncharacterized protein n=1 Tax=Luteolibacter soli TaxID=3135280 RepID=A0ABU9AYN7_9BACT